MSKVKPSDFTTSHLDTISSILNKGNQAEVKRERDNIVIVEIKRTALEKSPIEEDK